MNTSILVFLFAVFLQTLIYKCEANKCSSLGTFYNGKITYDRSPSNGKYPVSTIAYYSCNVGYIQPDSQSRSAICRESGNWASPGQKPKRCLAFAEKCPRPNLPYATLGFSNIFPDDQNQREGIIVDFFCVLNYIRHGYGSARCDSEGNWISLNNNNQSPACIATCWPYILLYGQVNYNRNSVHGRYPYGTVVSFSCNSGYSRSGPSSTFCTFAAIWNPVDVKCNQVTCQTLWYLKNGGISYSKASVNSDADLPYGTVASFSCKGGYSISGASSSTCAGSGTWSHSKPTCSKNPPPPQKPCFPSSSSVLLKSGKSVTMSELQIGDRVKTALQTNCIFVVSSSGVITYSKVTAFLKKQPRVIRQYKSIATVNETLTLSGNHLIFARKTTADVFNTIYAEQLSIGDEVLVQTDSVLIPQKVVYVHDVSLSGAFVPLVPEGKIMVDGVLASCYADFNHDVAHLTMIPMQSFPAVMEWLFGEDAGFPVYVSTARQLGMLLLPSHNLLIY